MFFRRKINHSLPTFGVTGVEPAASCSRNKRLTPRLYPVTKLKPRIELESYTYHAHALPLSYKSKSIFEKSRFELELLVHEISYRIEDSNLTCQDKRLELYPVKLYLKDTQYSRGDSNPLTSASAELRSSH